AVVILMIACVMVGMSISRPVVAADPPKTQPVAAAADAPAASGPHYTIVETNGINLLVTDNFTNTVYYYTIEKDGKPGDDLMLRGSADLTQVGKPVLKLKKAEGAKP